MAAKLLASASHTPTDVFALVSYHFNEKCLFVDSIGGEESSAANDCVKFFEHTDLASLQLDPGGYL